MDADGLCDAVELATGTRPTRADTDGDGVPDGVEDRNRDGNLDEGETDPRVPGLFPGAPPHVPEPMMFDLVRGLGARKGEIEVNALTVVGYHPETSVQWAPEVEWALADGVALELELPMHARELDALKSAFQVTLPGRSSKLIQGVQFLGEYFLSAHDFAATGLHLLGARAARWSILNMGGLRLTSRHGRDLSREALLNPSLFFDAHEQLTFGVEGNLAFEIRGQRSIAAIPQVHWQISRRLRIQVGLGARSLRGRIEPLSSARVILE